MNINICTMDWSIGVFIEFNDNYSEPMDGWNMRMHTAYIAKIESAESVYFIGVL